MIGQVNQWLRGIPIRLDLAPEAGRCEQSQDWSTAGRSIGQAVTFHEDSPHESQLRTDFLQDLQLRSFDVNFQQVHWVLQEGRQPAQWHGPDAPGSGFTIPNHPASVSTFNQE